MADTSITVIKTLFALSCNRCAFPGCEERLTDPAWEQVNAQKAHICGERPAAPRYNDTMTPAEREAFANLMLMCPNHHRRIDYLVPDEYPVDVLREMKAHHETECERTSWAPTDEQQEEFARFLLELEPPLPTPPTGTPRLVVEKDDDAIEVVNVGDGDAVQIGVDPLDESAGGAFVRAGDAPDRLSPGARWRAGIHAATMADAGPHVVRLTWRGDDGASYSGDFPVG